MRCSISITSTNKSDQTCVFLLSWQVNSVFKQRHGQVLRLQKGITKPGFHGKKTHQLSSELTPSPQVMSCKPDLSSVENETRPSSSFSAKRNKTIKVEQFCRSQKWLKGPQFRGVYLLFNVSPVYALQARHKWFDWIFLKSCSLERVWRYDRINTF